MQSKPPFDIDKAQELLSPLLGQLDTALETLNGERMGFMIVMWTESHDLALGNVDLPTAVPALQHIVNEVLQSMQHAAAQKERVH